MEYDTRDDFTKAIQGWEYDRLVERGKYLAREALARRATMWEREQLGMLREEWRRRKAAGLLPPRT